MNNGLTPDAEHTTAAEAAGQNTAALPSTTDSSDADALKVFSRRRAERLKDLSAGLEFLIYVELAVLYYLDNLTLLLLIRSSIQRLTLISLNLPMAPQLLSLPPPLSTALRRSGDNSSHLATMLSITLLGLLLHILLPSPTAGELTRGYLQGGLIIDFIGQKAAGPWTTRMKLASLDLLIGLLQVVLFATIKETTRIHDAEVLGLNNAQRDDFLQIFARRTPPMASNTRSARRSSSHDESEGESLELEPLRSTETETGDLTTQEEPSLIEDWNNASTVVINIQPLKTLQDCFWELRHRNRGAV